MTLNKTNTTHDANQMRLVRIGKADVDCCVINDLKNLVFESEDLYPGIDHWYKRQVEPGYTDGSRVSFIVYEKEVPIASMVIRLTNLAKLCSLRVVPEARGMGIGSALFKLAADEIGQNYNRFHFTAPESLVVRAKDYFRRIGFECRGAVNKHYRPGEGEFGFTGRVDKIKKLISSNVDYTLFGTTMYLKPPRVKWLIMSIKPEFATKIIEGIKVIELRRQFSETHQGSRILIYSSSPQQALLGYAKLRRVQRLKIKDIKEEFVDGVGCDESQIDDYSSGVDSLWALTLSDVNPFDTPISRKVLENYLETELRPPVSHATIDKNSSWWRVIDTFNSFETRNDLFGLNQDEHRFPSFTSVEQSTFW